MRKFLDDLERHLGVDTVRIRGREQPLSLLRVELAIAYRDQRRLAQESLRGRPGTEARGGGQEVPVLEDGVDRGVNVAGVETMFGSPGLDVGPLDRVQNAVDGHHLDNAPQVEAAILELGSGEGHRHSVLPRRSASTSRRIARISSRIAWV